MNTKNKKSAGKQKKHELPEQREQIISEQIRCIDEKREMPEKETFLIGKSDKNLYIIIGIVLAIIIALLFYGMLSKPPRALTLDEYHELNLQGKLKPEQGYVYSGFSFVNFNGAWFTRFQSNTTSQIYNVELRYGPNDVSKIPIQGDYNYILGFNSTFMTFDPIGGNLKYVALAAADLSSSMATIFHVFPFAACTRNETLACSTRPMVQCKQGVPVVYIKEDPTPLVKAEGTCLIIQGQGFELIKAVDRLLLAWYGIMP